MRDKEKSARGLLGRVSQRRWMRRNQFPPPAFEYYEVRMGCLEFVCCRHKRTD